jgi:uncharacterized LabA/DUF88 family protein
MEQKQGFAALFIDFENVFYYLYQRFNDLERSSDAVSEMIRKLRNRVEDEVPLIVMHAYADFERVETKTQGPLNLMGVETHNVVGTEHKNAADMRLCIDVLETMYTRPEINRFVFMAGDRDYIPVVQHLRKHAKRVEVASFQDSMSGDLRQMLGESHFIDSKTLLSALTLSEMEAAQKAAAQAKAEEEARVNAVAATKVVRAKAAEEKRFERESPITSEDELQALEIMLREFGDKPEVWVTPYLHKLRQYMSHLAEYERKALINNLEFHGACRVEKRPGDPAPYSVIVINWKHKDVIRLNP